MEVRNEVGKQIGRKINESRSAVEKRCLTGEEKALKIICQLFALNLINQPKYQTDRLDIDQTNPSVSSQLQSFESF